MNLKDYQETGTCNAHKQCHVCGETKTDNFTHYDRKVVGSVVWVCSTCKLTARGLEQIRVKIKPVNEMDQEELLDEMNDLLGTKYQWANIPAGELRKLVHAIRGGIHNAVQKAIDQLQYDSDESDLGQISGQAFIIRWKQATKHLTRMPESTKYAVADAIIRDLGGIPPNRPIRKDKEE